MDKKKEAPVHTSLSYMLWHTLMRRAGIKEAVEMRRHVENPSEVQVAFQEAIHTVAIQLGAVNDAIMNCALLRQPKGKPLDKQIETIRSWVLDCRAAMGVNLQGRKRTRMGDLVPGPDCGICGAKDSNEVQFVHPGMHVTDKALCEAHLYQSQLIIFWSTVSVRAECAIQQFIEEHRDKTLKYLAGVLFPQKFHVESSIATLMDNIFQCEKKLRILFELPPIKADQGMYAPVEDEQQEEGEEEEEEEEEEKKDTDTLMS